MHFHLPKPLHGWREFAGEVGIIVIGVLIALSAEQVLERLRWQHEVSEARSALKEEIEGHSYDATEITMAEPCVDEQLMDLEKALLAAGPYKPVPLYTDQQNFRFTYRTPARNWTDNVWRSIVSEGVVSHFDRNLRLQLARHYSQIAEQGERVVQADAIEFRMRVLAQPIQPDQAARAAMAAELEQARGINQLMALVSNQVLRDADMMGFPPNKKQIAQYLSTSGTLTFCRAHHLPIGRPEPQGPR